MLLAASLRLLGDLDLDLELEKDLDLETLALVLDLDLVRDLVRDLDLVPLDRTQDLPGEVEVSLVEVAVEEEEEIDRLLTLEESGEDSRSRLPTNGKVLLSNNKDHFP